MGRLTNEQREHVRELIRAGLPKDEIISKIGPELSDANYSFIKHHLDGGRRSKLAGTRKNRSTRVDRKNRTGNIGEALDKLELERHRAEEYLTGIDAAIASLKMIDDCELPASLR